MKKSRFTEEKMVTILREAGRATVAEVARKHKVSEAAIYVWRKHFGWMGAADAKRLNVPAVCTALIFFIKNPLSLGRSRSGIMLGAFTYNAIQIFWSASLVSDLRDVSVVQQLIEVVLPVCPQFFLSIRYATKSKRSCGAPSRAPVAGAPQLPGASSCSSTPTGSLPRSTLRAHCGSAPRWNAGRAQVPHR